MSIFPSPPDCVIVGSGIAGLAAAYELARRGVAVRVLERDARAGGLILTEHVDGYVIDAGPDSMLAQKPAAIELCRELGLAERLVSTLEPRTAYILRGGRLHAFQEGSVLGLPVRVRALAASSFLSAAAKARMAAEVFVPRRSWSADDDESIAGFVERRFGRELATFVAEPLLAGIHVGDADRLSIRALFPRLVQAEIEHGSVIRALRRQPPARSREGAFRSLAGGVGELVAALMRALPEGTVRCGANVERLEGAGPFRLHLSNGDIVQARSVILATPAHVTAAIVRPLDAQLAGLCETIPYASSAAIVLGYPRDCVTHPLAGSGFVVPRTENSALLAASWVSSKWPGRAPEGIALIRAFVGGARDPAIVDREDRELVDQAHDELEPLLGLRRPPLLTRVYRWRRANAQYEVGHLTRVRAIDQRLLRHHGLHVTGSGFRGVGIPDCVADARATAAAAADMRVGIR